MAGTREDGRTSVDDFYAWAMDEAEGRAFEVAGKTEGLDQEIAVLRTKLRSLSGDPELSKEQFALMLRGIDQLVKAVSARYRLSPKAEKDLASNLTAIIRGVGGTLLPERFDDG